MCDQLKAFGKCLILGFLLLPAIAKEPVLDAGRLIEEGDTKILQTALWSYEKDGVQLDLIGAVHIADEEYYAELNTRFGTYDAVFYEMVANPSAIKALQEPVKKTVKKMEGDLDGLNSMYSLYSTMMDLRIQSQGIDYTAENFIHADMTEREFEAAQKEAGETIISAALGASSIDFTDIDQGIVMRAMMTGDSTLLKSELIGLLSSADDDLGAVSHDSVLVNGRNDVCLSIVKRNLEGNRDLKKVAIFYGAAHLPDFHRKLFKEGWVVSDKEWLRAWEIKASPPEGE